MTPVPSYTYEAELLTVTDGDTVKVRVDLGFSVLTKISVRLANVFAAERHEPNGPAHTAILRSLLPTGSKVVLVSHRTRGAERVTFGRYVADLYDLDGEHINAKAQELYGQAQGLGAGAL
jgi:endonuclease YncB( thermonuclease family)